MGNTIIEDRSRIIEDKRVYSDNYKLKNLVYRMQIALKTKSHTAISSLRDFTYDDTHRYSPFGFDEKKGGILKRKKLIYKNNCILHKLIRIQSEFKFVKNNIKLYKSLTLREKEIIQWLAKGYNNRQIGKNLFISRRTVEQHRKHINQKLGITSLPHLLQYTYSFNLI